MSAHLSSLDVVSQRPKIVARVAVPVIVGYRRRGAQLCGNRLDRDVADFPAVTQPFDDRQHRQALFHFESHRESPFANGIARERAL